MIVFDIYPNSKYLSMNTTIKDDFMVPHYPLYIIGALLLSAPTLACFCCMMPFICEYIKYYRRNIQNSMDNSNNQTKFRGVIDCVFGSTSTPMLTKVIVVSLCNPNP